MDRRLQPWLLPVQVQQPGLQVHTPPLQPSSSYLRQRLFEELRQAGFTGDYTILTDYVRAWHVSAAQARAKRAPLCR